MSTTTRTRLSQLTPKSLLAAERSAWRHRLDANDGWTPAHWEGVRRALNIYPNLRQPDTSTVLLDRMIAKANGTAIYLAITDYDPRGRWNPCVRAMTVQEFDGWVDQLP